MTVITQQHETVSGRVTFSDSTERSESHWDTELCQLNNSLSCVKLCDLCVALAPCVRMIWRYSVLHSTWIIISTEEAYGMTYV